MLVSTEFTALEKPVIRGLTSNRVFDYTLKRIRFGKSTIWEDDMDFGVNDAGIESCS